MAPAVKRTIPPMSATSTAIDMLGSSRISREVNPSTTRKGITPFLNCRTWSPFLVASMAHQMMTARRASSETWNQHRPEPDPPPGAIEAGSESRAVNGRTENESEARSSRASSGQASGRSKR